MFNIEYVLFLNESVAKSIAIILCLWTILKGPTFDHKGYYILQQTAEANREQPTQKNKGEN